MPLIFGFLRPASARSLTRAAVLLGAALALSIAVDAQQPPTVPIPASNQAPATPDAAATAAQTVAPAPAPEPSMASSPTPSEQSTSPVPAGVDTTSPAIAPGPVQAGATTEDDLKKLLVGKVLYLRGGYLDDNLSFNEHGVLSGHSPQGSYTLSGVSIEKVRLTKHKVELEGQRYGLHFLGALPSEDPTTAMDRVQISPKKKVVRITIDREAVIVPKKSKDKKEKDSKITPIAAEQTNAYREKVPATDGPADAASVTTTTSPAHAAGVLHEAIDHIFSIDFDERMKAAMPDFWKLYFQAVAAKADYRPADPAVQRQSAVDKKARLISVFEPASNEYAQAHGVAGLALYHVIIGPDGKPGEIAVARPIGFGLDENAVASIRKAAFEPATKNGQPVPVMLDLIVEFHIYSGLTGGTRKPEPADAESAKLEKPSSTDPPATLMLPGPYSVPHH